MLVGFQWVVCQHILDTSARASEGASEASECSSGKFPQKEAHTFLRKRCKGIVFGCQPSPLASYLYFGGILTQEYCYKTGQEMLSCDFASLLFCEHKFTCLVGALLKDIGVWTTICEVCVTLCCMKCEITTKIVSGVTHEHICICNCRCT